MRIVKCLLWIGGFILLMVLAYIFTSVTSYARGSYKNRMPPHVGYVLGSIRKNCKGFRIISHYRPRARVAGTRRTSLHAYGLAVDFKVRNYSCAMKILRRTKGIGFSKDYKRCGHIHVSEGNRERRGFLHGRC